VIFANRAMANIRLSNMDAAVSDCTMSLGIDPTYTKALSRRGMVHHRCGRYRLAEDDFRMCIKREPDNKEFAALLKRSTEKVRVCEERSDEHCRRTYLMSLLLTPPPLSLVAAQGGGRRGHAPEDQEEGDDPGGQRLGGVGRRGRGRADPRARR